MRAAVLIVVAVLESACPGGDIFEQCPSETPLKVTVGTEECTESAPSDCVVDFGDVVVPLAEQLRVAVEAQERCSLFAFFETGGNGDGVFSISSQASNGPVAFAQVQFAPEETGDFEGTLDFEDGAFALAFTTTLRGTGVAP